MSNPSRIWLPAVAFLALAAPVAAQCVDYTEHAHLISRQTMEFFMKDLVADGDHAYATTFDNSLVVMDIGDPLQPRAVGEVPLVPGPEYLVQRDQYVFASGHGYAVGIYAVDVSMPAAPVEVGYLSVTEGTQILMTHGDLLVVQRHLADIIDIVDASDPADMTVLSSISRDGQALASNGGDLIYIRTRTRLEVWDLSDPVWPTQRGTVDLPGFFVGTSMVLHGTSLLLAPGASAAEATVVDVADPDAPFVAQTFGLRYSIAGAIMVGDLAYFPLNSGAVDLYDLADFDAPVYRSSLVGDATTAAALTGNHLVCADGAVLSVYDTTGAHLSYPEAGFHDWVYGFSFSAERHADHVYVGGQFGLFAFDVSDYTAPVVSFSENGSAAVAMAGEILYATRDRALTVYSIDDPAMPSAITAFERPWWNSSPPLYVAGDVLVVDTADSLLTFDISSPASPQPLGGRAFDTSVVTIDAGLLYALTDTALHILDLADPVNLPQLGQTHQPDGESVAVHDGYAYICNSAYANGLLWIMDVRDPTDPAFATAQEGIYIRGLSVHGNQLLATQGGWGVQLLDVADPLAPTYSGHLYRGYDTGWVYRARAVGDLVWLGRDDGVGFIPTPCIDVVSSVTDEPGGLPRTLQLSSHPNPFNPQVTIRFEVPQRAFVDIEIFDLRGRRLRRLLNREPHEAGPYTVLWLGNDDAGRALASGVYVARVRAGVWTAAQKLTLVR